MAVAKTAAGKATALTGFVCEIKGEQHLFQQGQRVTADHPAVKAHPELFEKET
jgi:hypothetical protein